MEDCKETRDDEIFLILGMRWVVEYVVILNIDIHQMYEHRDSSIQGAVPHPGDSGGRQRQINSAAAALRRLAVLMVNSDPNSDICDRQILIKHTMRVRRSDVLEVSDFLAAMKYFNSAFRHYAYVYYNPDHIEARSKAALAKQEKLERLVERELLTAIIELEKLRQLIAGLTPAASTAI